jgi:hypothetical protein
LAPLAARAGPAELRFSELYVSRGPLGLEFSERVKTLAGKPVAMRGFMAPPLKAEATFFVLTREPVALCPFCDSDKDWPADIVVVHLGREQEFVQNNQTIEVTGTLEVGVKVDAETRFLSRLRLVDARFRRV